MWNLTANIWTWFQKRGEILGAQLKPPRCLRAWGVWVTMAPPASWAKTWVTGSRDYCNPRYSLIATTPLEKAWPFSPENREEVIFNGSWFLHNGRVSHSVQCCTPTGRRWHTYTPPTKTKSFSSQWQQEWERIHAVVLTDKVPASMLFSSGIGGLELHV
jgi:hypothetical protein